MIEAEAVANISNQRGHHGDAAAVPARRDHGVARQVARREGMLLPLQLLLLLSSTRDVVE